MLRAFLGRLGTHIGVPGFFTLSSYLLTFNLHHSMIKIFSSIFDILNADVRLKMVVNLVKYAIKRILRIMPPFLFVVILGKEILPALCGNAVASFPYVSFYEIVTLKTAGLTVFWTIPVEMRYYLVIPVYVIAIHISSWFLPVFVIASMSIAAYEGTA
ncbi:hypothetical protein BC829DRAFT_267972 [Chytridium lagenaria]|nr:hypothetical protein BC829DRAFT_267972 [Chytridium lagenaria]